MTETKLIDCRYGLMTVFPSDTSVSRSLIAYGEWAQNEVEFLLRFLDHDSVVLDVGAYIGTHVLAFASVAGMVHAIEPRPEFFNVLSENVNRNAVKNVHLIHAGASNKAGKMTVSPIDLGATINGSELKAGKGHEVELIRVDDLHLEKLRLLKVDVEGMEPKVLVGALDTIAHCKPVIYCECFSVESGMAMTRLLSPFGYHSYLHLIAFNPHNFYKNPVNIFGTEIGTCSLLLIPNGGHIPAVNQCDYLVPTNTADDLALALLRVPVYKYKTLAECDAAKLLGADFFTVNYEERQRYEDSLSWRITAPLRMAGRWLLKEEK